MRLPIILGVVFLAAGCTTVPYKELKTDVDVCFLQEPHFLSRLEAQQARLNQFIETNHLFTEKIKIQYLLSAVRSSEGTFIRNGTRYNGVMAAEWLKWKMHHPQYRDHPIDTARDFVDKVSKGSNSSGIPYQTLLPDGSLVRTQVLLSHELDALEKAIRAKMLLSVIPQPSAELETGHKAIQAQDGIPVAALLPAAR